MLLKNISYSYQRNLRVINSFSYDFSKAGIYVITGKNGSGKTTLLKIMSGLLKNYSGTLDVCNKNVIAALEFLGFDGDLSIANNLKLFSPDNRIQLHRINTIASQLGFRHSLSFKFKKLSSGNQFKIRYLITLLLNSDVLLFDEPLNYLDEEGKKGFIKIICEESAKGKIIVLSCHNLIELDMLKINYTLIQLP